MLTPAKQRAPNNAQGTELQELPDWMKATNDSDSDSNSNSNSTSDDDDDDDANKPSYVDLIESDDDECCLPRTPKETENEKGQGPGQAQENGQENGREREEKKEEKK